MPTFAQPKLSDSFAIAINNVFQYAEKNRVASGHLKDYSLDLVYLKLFDGTDLIDSNYALPSHWFKAYKNVMSAKINSSGPVFKHPTAIMGDADSIMSLGIIPIDILFYKYDKYRDDAYSAGMITVINSQVRDKYNNSVWVNPYESKYGFAASQMTLFTKSRNSCQTNIQAIWSIYSTTYQFSKRN